MSKRNQPRQLPRHKRKHQIQRHLQRRQRASMSQIAHALDLRPSSKLMDILWELVDEGHIIAIPRSYNRGCIQAAWTFEGVTL